MSARIGITMGDPAGIGPEIILKALAELAKRDGEAAVSPVVYGTRSVMEAAAAALGLAVAFVEPSRKPAWPTVITVMYTESNHDQCSIST